MGIQAMYEPLDEALQSAESLDPTEAKEASTPTATIVGNQIVLSLRVFFPRAVLYSEDGVNHL